MPQDPRRHEGETFFLPAARATATEVEEASAHVSAAKTVGQVLEGVPGPAVVVTELRQIVAANRRLLDDLGLDTVEEVLGRRPGEALGCRNVTDAPSGCGTGRRCLYCGLVQAILRCLETERTATDECRIARTDGSALDLEVSATPTLLDDLPVVFVALRDVSAEKRRRVLERTFFHDLLNTAGGLRGLLSMAEASENPQDRARLRGSLLALADDLIGEIRDHRRLCDAEEGNLELHPRPAAVGRIVEDLGLLYLSHESARGRTLALAGAPDLVVDTDLGLLRRVLGNMLKNALEATPERGQVRFWAEGSDGEVAFRVRNPGVMPEDVRLQVFQRSFTTKGEGRGLGTYAMKLLGERYLGGRIDFTSEAPEGTTFTFRLPARAGAVDDPMARATFDGAHVLVVDDVRLNRLILRHLLERRGVRVDEAHDGHSALVALARHDYDLVLLDIEMPGMDGLDLAREVRAREAEVRRHTPLVALTGYDARKERERHLAAGLDEILEKPVDGRTLAEVLGRRLAQHV